MAAIYYQVSGPEDFISEPMFATQDLTQDYSGLPSTSTHMPSLSPTATFDCHNSLELDSSFTWPDTQEIPCPSLTPSTESEFSAVSDSALSWPETTHISQELFPMDVNAGIASHVPAYHPQAQWKGPMESPVSLPSKLEAENAHQDSNLGFLDVGQPMFNGPMANFDGAWAVAPVSLAQSTPADQAYSQLDSPLMQPSQANFDSGFRRHSNDFGPREARSHPWYKIGPKEDGLYHCPVPECRHPADKLKCNYDKHLDGHLKPYTCKVPDCQTTRFSSTACVLRHEREAHGMHGHGHKPFVCQFPDCDRANPTSGFPRRWNLHDHMKRVHNYKAQDCKKTSPLTPPESPELRAPGPQRTKRNGAKARNSKEDTIKAASSRKSARSTDAQDRTAEQYMAAATGPDMHQDQYSYTQTSWDPSFGPEFSQVWIE